ncbi:rCG29245, isoform CRA_a [Rattus norvegicus]|uniref:RCG29245, isoform CRA_a n=1 Tax=Rattus norvegicus TaxID=10116 RepID=A6K8U5_RAT|nr:rCG29245, isoform CRA_a [Rattus norvegicus]EDL89365.1 rCG29245, isoform CRA_a [Rattus norvegicus]
MPVFCSAEDEPIRAFMLLSQRSTHCSTPHFSFCD